MVGEELRMKTNKISNMPQLFLKTSMLLCTILVLYIIFSKVAFYDYYLYHSIIETMTIFANFIVLIIMITIWKYAKNNFFIGVIGISLGFITILDILHIISYEDGGHFTSHGSNLTIQLWIIGRYIQAFTIMGAVFLSRWLQKVKWHYVVGIYFIITMLGIYSTVFSDWFPMCYIEGKGLSVFKIVSEYVIVAVLCVSLVCVIKSPTIKNNKSVYLVAYLSFFIASELIFTLYISLTGFSNFLGHIFRLIAASSFVVYFLEISLSQPNMYLFNKLKASEKQLEKIAYFDSVTGLYNRSYLPIMFEKFKKIYEQFYFIYIDIYHFYAIIQLHGRETANNIIQEFSNRIKSLKLDDKELFKLLKDDFIIMYPCNNGHKALRRNIRRLITILEKPYIIDNSEIYLNVNIGACKYPDDAMTLDAMFSYSIMALLSAKTSKLKNYMVFDNTMFQKQSRLNQIELSIDSAFENHEFTTVFQPIIDVNDARIMGFEALSRWNHPRLGYISPAEFIPILEKTRKVYLLDKYVLDNTMLLANKIKNISEDNYLYTVNFSALSISYNNFDNIVNMCFQNGNLEKQFLAIELTESQVIDDLMLIHKKINRLRKDNIQFYVDDFGEGYSSVHYLASLNFDAVKISKSFTDKLISSDQNKTLLKNVVRMVKDLNYKVVIEGVETFEIFNMCKEMGVDYVQGYYFYPELQKIKEELKDRERLQLKCSTI